ncbi:MAG: hypothetical protein WC822_07045 [Candidatus Paceibacterota bacterium]|jgi:hypothetical protein
MENKFEVGQVFEVVDTNLCGNFDTAANSRKAKYIKIISTDGNFSHHDHLTEEMVKVGNCCGCFYPKDIGKGINLKYISSGTQLISSINKTTNNMNLVEKAKLAFKGEPEKTFIKAGVMDSNENLTAEGRDLFLTYLLKENGAAFKEKVIDPILAAEETK